MIKTHAKPSSGLYITCMGVYAYIKTHTCTHRHACMYTHTRTHTQSSLVELSCSRFEVRELSWADIPFLTYVLSSGYFMTATGKEGNDNRPIEEEFLVVLWLSPMIHMCAHFFTQTEVYTHYRAPPHLYRAVPAVRKLVQPKHLVWT